MAGSCRAHARSGSAWAFVWSSRVEDGRRDLNKRLKSVTEERSKIARNESVAKGCLCELQSARQLIAPWLGWGEGCGCPGPLICMPHHWFPNASKPSGWTLASKHFGPFSAFGLFGYLLAGPTDAPKLGSEADGVELSETGLPASQKKPWQLLPKLLVRYILFVKSAHTALSVQGVLGGLFAICLRACHFRKNIVISYSSARGGPFILPAGKEVEAAGPLGRAFWRWIFGYVLPLLPCRSAFWRSFCVLGRFLIWFCFAFRARGECVLEVYLWGVFGYSEATWSKMILYSLQHSPKVAEVGPKMAPTQP